MRDITVTEFNDSELVPFDIETTGFEAADEVTTLTFYVDETYYVFINTGEKSDYDFELDKGVNHPSVESEEIKQKLLEQNGINNVEIFTDPSEKELLTSARDIVDDTIEWDEYYITAYNGEKWNGGFDLAFLRSAATKYDVVTPFRGLYYIDLYPVFGKERINTVGPSISHIDTDIKEGFHDVLDYGKWRYPETAKNLDAEELIELIQSKRPSFSSIREWYDERGDYLCTDNLPTKRYKDLVMAHYLLSVELYGEDEEMYLNNDFDPFDDSKEAVTNYTQGNIEPVVLHNVADVKKTLELSNFIERISEDDVKWRQIPW